MWDTGADLISIFRANISFCTRFRRGAGPLGPTSGSAPAQGSSIFQYYSFKIPRLQKVTIKSQSFMRSQRSGQFHRFRKPWCYCLYPMVFNMETSTTNWPQTAHIQTACASSVLKISGWNIYRSSQNCAMHGKMRGVFLISIFFLNHPNVHSYVIKGSDPLLYGVLNWDSSFVEEVREPLVAYFILPKALCIKFPHDFKFKVGGLKDLW